MKVGSWHGVPALLGAAVAALALVAPVVAQREHGAGPSHWRGDISRFQQHDRQVWRGGHWVHNRHDGRLGWWWVAGGSWYLYPSPVYPYPDPWLPPAYVPANPPATVAAPLPPVQYWYYCEAYRTYYPYAATCPGGWQQVPATPPDSSSVPR